jgi:hypothetical protein
MLRKVTTMPNRTGETFMPTPHASLRRLFLAGSALLALGGSAFAADVTPDRLANPDKEPGNWLMNRAAVLAARGDQQG